MSVDKCIADLKKAAGTGTLTDDQLASIGEKVSTIIQNLERKNLGEGLDAAVMKAIEEAATETKLAAIIAQRNEYKNRYAQLTVTKQIWDTWKGNHAEGVKAFLGGSLSAKFAGKRSVARDQVALSDYYTSALDGMLSKADVLKAAKSGDYDKQVYAAMWQLGQETPDFSGLPKESVAIARAYHAMNEKARIDANAAGAWIKSLPGYVAKRSHDQGKIAKAGGDGIPWGDQRHQDAWVEFVSSRMDWDKTMPDVPMDERNTVLKSMFIQFATGKHQVFSDGGASGLSGVANVGKRMSHDRVLQFKDWNAEWDYHQKFSQGTLLENMITGMSHMARDTAMMRRLGPNAEMNWRQITDTIDKRLLAANDTKQRAKFINESAWLKKNLWPNLTGESSVAGSFTGAKISKMVREVEMMADLGGAMLSSLNDVATSGAVARKQGVSMLDGMAQAVEGVFHDTPQGEMRQVASELGILADNMRSTGRAYDAIDNLPGTFAKTVNNFFRYSLLGPWTDRLRTTFGFQSSNRLAANVGKSFDDLPMGKLLSQYGIDAAKWDVIRQAKTRLADGREYLTPESIKELPDDVIAPNEKNKVKINRIRDDLSDSVRAYISDQSHTAVLEPDAMDRAIMLRGTQPGTVEGESLRHVMMYKSFMSSFTRKILGGEVFGYSNERLPLGAQLKAILTTPGGGELTGLANIIAWSTAFGYLSMSAKDLVKGKMPRAPDDAAGYAKVLSAAFVQGSGAGIYGDFLFGEARSRFGSGPLETFLGPTWRRGEDVYGLYQAAREGKDVGAKGLRTLINNTPFINLFYTRTALDYLILFRMQEWANPGALRRMEQNMKEQKDQQYIFAPSSVIPYGG